MGLFDELKKLTKPYAEDDELNDDLEELPARQVYPRRSYTDYAEAPKAPEPTTHRSFIPRFQSEGKGLDLTGRSQQTQTQSQNPGQAPRLVAVRPTRFEDAGDIADKLRQRCAIVLNLEALSAEVARRLVDFLSGAAYIMDGRIRRVSTDTYVITPTSMDLMGGELEALGTKENYF